jgi:hypothetical protein
VQQFTAFTELAIRDQTGKHETLVRLFITIRHYNTTGFVLSGPPQILSIAPREINVQNYHTITAPCCNNVTSNLVPVI